MSLMREIKTRVSLAGAIFYYNFFINFINSKSFHRHHLTSNIFFRVPPLREGGVGKDLPYGLIFRNKACYVSCVPLDCIRITYARGLYLAPLYDTVENCLL